MFGLTGVIPELCEGVENATDAHVRFHVTSALHFALLQLKGAYQAQVESSPPTHENSNSVAEISLLPMETEGEPESRTAGTREGRHAKVHPTPYTLHPEP